MKQIILIFFIIAIAFGQQQTIQPQVFNGLYKRDVCQSGCCCQNLTQIQYFDNYNSQPSFSFTNIFLSPQYDSCNITSPQLNTFTYVGSNTDFWTDLQNYGQINYLQNEFKNIFEFKLNGTNIEVINQAAPYCNSLLLNITNLFVDSSEYAEKY